MVKAIKAAQSADQIRDYLAEWSHTDGQGFFFTLTECTVSPDLQQATLWVDVLEKGSEEKVLKLLRRKSASYKRRLHTVLKRKILPILRFELDTRAERWNLLSADQSI